MNWLPELLTGLKDIVIVVFLGYGLKLVKQQNDLLEREKALKQSKIEVHKANIERLKALQAPAIARDLEQMTHTADQLAKRKQELEEKVEALSTEKEKVEALSTENHALAKMADLSYLNGVAAGSLEALGILQNSTEYAALAGLSGQSFDSFLRQKLHESSKSIAHIADDALNGNRPEMKEFKKWMLRAKGEVPEFFPALRPPA